MGFFHFIKKPFSFTITQSLGQQDREFIMQKWQEIEELMRLQKPTAFKQAIIEADKLLGFVLEKMGFQGSLGDKLNASKIRFSSLVYNDLWEAHKTRNRLVHEIGSNTMSFEAQRAISNFKRGLKELGAI